MCAKKGKKSGNARAQGFERLNEGGSSSAACGEALASRRPLRRLMLREKERAAQARAEKRKGRVDAGSAKRGRVMRAMHEKTAQRASSTPAEKGRRTISAPKGAADAKEEETGQRHFEG